MSRLPIRLKLALASTAVMAVVLLAVITVLYARFTSELDLNIDGALRTQADALVQVARRDGAPAMLAVARRGEGLVQLVRRDGAVLGGTDQVSTEPLLTPAELARARRGQVLARRGRIGDVGKHIRMVAEPVPGRDMVVVVGRSQKDRESAVDSLASALAVGGPLALVLASLAGYAIGAAALRPVERMRRRAAEISHAEPGARLPVPETQDEIAALGTTLNEMLARLELTLARERSATATARAELRGPLELLREELEAALARRAPIEEMQAALRAAAEETDRLSQLADELLAVRRADEGRLPVRLQDTEIPAIVTRAGERATWRSLAMGRDLEIIAQPVPRLRADPRWLEQALDHLLDNALVYGDGKVRVFTMVRNGDIEVHVTDEGPGFPSDFLPRAFERFSRADTASGRGGAGFGLAVVEAVAHAHGGRARAANRPEGGADVWIVLPRAESG